MTTAGGLRVGFIGLGVMGLPMAANIRSAGFDLLGFDASPSAVERATVAGIALTDSLGNLIDRSDVVIAMLPDTPQVEAIVDAEDGLVIRGRSGLVFVDMSTISPQGAQAINARVSAAGIRMLDAPVSGGHQKAITGNLSIMVGGERSTLDEVAPVLAVLGTPVLMGGPGAGQATKACNQVAVTLTIQAACEAFALGSKLGLDLTQLREVLLGGSASSWLLENMGPQILAGDDQPGFRVALQVKDLRIAAEAAFATQTWLPGLSTILGLYTEAIAHGQLNDGNQSIARTYERITGAVIGASPHAAGVGA